MSESRQPGPEVLLSSARIAIVHDWLLQWGGAEAVLKAIVDIFPKAQLFSVCDFLDEGARASLGIAQSRSTFIQRLPGARRWARRYLPLMPLAIEQLDLQDYDLVISNSHAVAKGILSGPEQLHLSYVHTPMRYAWDMQAQYLATSGLDRGLRGGFAKLILHYMRLWDARTGAGVDAFAANSRHVARRINKCYRRAAEVIYPPVTLEEWPYQGRKHDYYVIVSRLVPYKLVPVVVEAFAGMRHKRRLVVVGEGPEMGAVKQAAKGASNIEILGRQPRRSVIELVSGARALVHMALEDFGIVMVEALSSGTPVIAYGKGGAREIVADGRTGCLFYQQSASALIDAIDRFEASEPLDGHACNASAQRFSVSSFADGFTGFVERHWREHRLGLELAPEAEHR